MQNKEHILEGTYAEAVVVYGYKYLLKMEQFCPCLISCKPLSNEFSHLNEIKLTTPCFSIGRGLSNALQIPCLTISRHHCKLMKKDDSWIIEDNSSSGIHVNNTSVGKGNVTTIKHGDTITLDAGHEFIYKFLSEDEGPTPRKRIKLDADKTILINEVTSQLEELQNNEFKQIEEKSHNNKKLENTKKILVEQTNLNMRHEKEEMSKKLIESQKNAEKAISELKAKVAATAEELAALKNERIQKQAEQSTETISSLQDQLTKVTSELENIKHEKSILLENTTTASMECSKQLEEFGDLMVDELQCSICAEIFINPTTLNCSHTFCQYCITMWKKKKKDCPICRTPIKSECRTLALDSFIEKMVGKLSSEVKQKRQEMLKARIEIESNGVLQENARKRRRNESEEEDSEYESFWEEEEEDDEIDYTRYLYSNYDEYHPYDFDSGSGSDY